MNRFYHVVHAILRPIVRLLFPTVVSGLENLPEDTGVVLCANHVSGWDPVLICLALPRSFPIRIMAKKELMDTPLLGWALRKIGAFGVDRGNSDLNAVKTAIKAIRDGENLLIFPEGTRVRGAGEVRAKGGVIMIAVRTGAALLPVYVEKRRLFRKVHIVFGAPYIPAVTGRHGTAEEYQTHADEIMRRAYALGDGEV